MNLRRAGKGIVRKGKRPSVYRIGFNDGDETELIANGMKKLDEIVESKAREYVKVQEYKAEEERGFRYFEIWDENGQSAKFYIVEQYLELSQSMMEAIAESLAKGEGK